MLQFDTSMGGPRADFPTTLWADLLEAGDPSAPESRAKLDRLLRAYWKPVYVYIRAAWRKSVDDAKDLTQAFFALLIERGYLSQVRPERGTFRGYLRTALKHFLINAKEQATVRGPQGPVIPLDAAPEEWVVLKPISPEESPEAAYDRTWIQNLVEGAIGSLRETLAAGNKEEYFAVFQRYCLEERSLTYREVGEVLGLSEADVRHRLEHVRTLLKRILRRRVRDYVSSEDEIEPELRELLGE